MDPDTVIEVDPKLYGILSQMVASLDSLWWHAMLTK